MSFDYEKQALKHLHETVSKNKSEFMDLDKLMKKPSFAESDFAMRLDASNYFGEDLNLVDALSKPFWAAVDKDGVTHYEQ